jgi:VIT1/CCC1 family predicted Fe2+/Mn2+ transporter
MGVEKLLRGRRGPAGGGMSRFFRALQEAEQDRVRRLPTMPSGRDSDRSIVVSAESRQGLAQLKLLFEYSKFQIGLYTAVAIIFAAVVVVDPAVFKVHRGLLTLAVILVSLAGFAAGIIASRCAHFTSRRELWTTKIGPFRSTFLTGEHWTYLGDACFGLALIAALLSALLGRAR